MGFDGRETYVVGDPHGVIEEFNLLLKKIKYNPEQHRVIICGDATDRGEDPVGLIHQIQDMNIEMILGNHEEKIIRWRKHEAFKEITGTPNPMKEPVPRRRKEWEALSKSDLKWMGSLPRTIQINENWICVHAGLENKKVEEQDPETIIRIRFVDEITGEYAKSKDKEQPKGSVFWAEKWEQPMNVIFGHTRFKEPKIFKNKNNVCVATDTGAVFGGMLTAVNIDRQEFVSVKSEKKYYP